MRMTDEIILRAEIIFVGKQKSEKNLKKKNQIFLHVLVKRKNLKKLETHIYEQCVSFGRKKIATFGGRWWVCKSHSKTGPTFDVTYRYITYTQ